MLDVDRKGIERGKSGGDGENRRISGNSARLQATGGIEGVGAAHLEPQLRVQGVFGRQGCQRGRMPRIPTPPPLPLGPLIRRMPSPVRRQRDGRETTPPGGTGRVAICRRPQPGAQQTALPGRVAARGPQRARGGRADGSRRSELGAAPEEGEQSRTRMRRPSEATRRNCDRNFPQR